MYFGRHQDGILENEFSGNLIEICPTGVFTDKTLKNHYTRKWDLTQAPSVCTHCSVGCNIIAGERYGILRRVLSRYNSEVNGYFLCDRGRFGYEFVNGDNRIRKAVFRIPESKEQIESEEDIITGLNAAIKDRITGIGSPRASLESNFILQQLVGPGNFYAGENRQDFDLNRKILHILKKGNIKTPSLKEIEEADAILILGEDITNTAPMMALAVRQAAQKTPLKKAKELNIPAWKDKEVREHLQETKGPVFTLTPYTTRLADISSGNYTATPDELAAFGFSLAHLIDNKSLPANTRKDDATLMQHIADKLKSAEKPLIISGTGCKNESVTEAAYNIAGSLHKMNKHTLLSYAVSECNTIGLAMMCDRNLDDLIESGTGKGTLIVLENDLYRRKDNISVDRLLQKFENVIVLDHLFNPTIARADVTIPAGTFAESQGTYVSNEGRAQRFYSIFEPSDTVKESWRWLESVALPGRVHSFYGKNYDEVVETLVAALPQFKGIDTLFPPSDFRLAGQKIPRQSPRYSGRTAMHANIDVNEPKPPEDYDSPLSFSMEGYQGQPPSSIIPFFWSPGWNSVQAVNKYQIEIGGHLHDGDPGLRLINPGNNEAPDYYEYRERQVRDENDDFLAIPVYHIFGGEELSAVSPSIKELSPLPYAGICTDDAKKLEISSKDVIILKTNMNEYELPVKIISGLTPGTIGIPSGLKDFYFDFEKPFVKINKTTNE